MIFTPGSPSPGSPASPTLFNPKDALEIMVAKVSGSLVAKTRGPFAVGYMDKYDPANALARLHIVVQTPDGEWATIGPSWVSASDIRYKVTSLEEGAQALRQLASAEAPAAKRVWRGGCPDTPQVDTGAIAPAIVNMSLAEQFFGTFEKLCVGPVSSEMVSGIAEALDTYCVREVAFSVNQDDKPPGPAASGSLSKCLGAFLELWEGFVVTETANLEYSAEGDEGEVITLTQRSSYHLLYGPGMGHDDEISQPIPGTYVTQSAQSNTVKYVISPGDKSKVIYWKMVVDMAQIKAARAVVEGLKSAEIKRIKEEEAARKKAEQERREGS